MRLETSLGIQANICERQFKEGMAWVQGTVHPGEEVMRAAAHTAPTVRKTKHWEMNTCDQLAFPFLFNPGAQPTEQDCPHSSGPSHLILPNGEIPSQTCPVVCLPSDSNINHHHPYSDSGLWQYQPSYIQWFWTVTVSAITHTVILDCDNINHHPDEGCQGPSRARRKKPPYRCSLEEGWSAWEILAEKPNLRRASGDERVAFLGRSNWYKKPELSQCQRITTAPWVSHVGAWGLRRRGGGHGGWAHLGGWASS